MKRRSKLYKKTIPCPKITQELIDIEAAICSVSDPSCLTDINFSETVIIDAIKELSPNSAAVPDDMPATLLIKCASEIAPLLRNVLLLLHFQKGISHHHLKEVL